MRLPSCLLFLQSKTRKSRWFITAIVSCAIVIFSAGITLAAALDFGDAPTTLSTIGSGPVNIVDAALTSTYLSANNTLNSTYHLGNLVDSEAANQPSPNADKDDKTNLADEDGVTFPLAGSTPILNAGQSNTLTINASNSGFLNAWIDWNQNGSWADSGEQVANNLALASGNNLLSVTVPNGAPHGSTYARFRFSQNSDSTGATGSSSQNGEVEDYQVNIVLPAPLACTAGILNNGFENPVIPASGTGTPAILTDFGNNRIVNYKEVDVPWWGTIPISPSSGSDFNNRNAIELWLKGNTQSPSTFEGNQFAELNANVAGELYQDVAVPPGTQIRWQVAHRGRSGTDTFGVYMGAPESETQQGSYSTPNTEWRVYSGLYVVPAGQYITRFGLRAISTAGGDNSVGNFVDDIRLTNFCVPTARGYKSVKLITDADNNGLISPGDTLTYTLYYVNASNSNTGPAASFQINDPLPTGLSITTTGTQTVTVSGGSTYANSNASYTGAATGSVSDLLDPGALLDVGGVIRVDIPVKVNSGTSGILQNQATSSATEFSGQSVKTDNVDSTTTGLPSGVTIPSSSVAQNQGSGIDPTSIQVIANTKTSANVLFVKRITAINGNSTQNPNDTTSLNQFVDDATTSDNNPFWPSNYLLGAIDGGKIKSGDTIEYTIYYLNAGQSDASAVRICDRISPYQTFKTGTYGVNQDLQVKVGTNATQGLTAVNDPGISGDRTQVYAANAAVPTACNLQAANTNGTVDMGLTGAANTGIPSLTVVPGATASGTPNNSYGWVRFTTTMS